jgi:uncharacterized membrane protein
MPAAKPNNYASPALPLLPCDSICCLQLGFLFTPCWLAAMLVPLCTRKRNDRLAGMASAVAFLIILVLAIALSVTQTRNTHRMHSTGFNQWSG